ncbi:MAG: 3-deoxy-D-manno-octulosonic acid transferase [Smithellaceae bacterium]
MNEKLLDRASEKLNIQSMYVLYNIILLAAAIIGIPYYFFKMAFTGKYRKSFIPKLGGRQTQSLAVLKNAPRVWIHAVSVGEVTAAAPIVASLKQKRPEAEIIFSTSTETGQEMAHRLIKDAAVFIYFPLDIPCVVRKMIRLVNPGVFAMVETELWPNFLKVCSQNNVQTLMVNGRISPRSFHKYQLTKFFWKRVLSNLCAAGMIARIDAERLESIGIDSGKIQILGNSKYDALAAMASPQLQEEIAGLFKVQENERFFVAGSTHSGEEAVVIDVYRQLIKRYPDFKLIIIPRHIERSKDVLELLHKYNLDDVITVSQMKNGQDRHGERIVIVDVIGELFKVYSLATVVYCGGSLVPKGGQNILEAAAWGKVIFYGPSMEDFTEEKALLENAAAGVTIRNGAELLQEIMCVLENPEELARRGVAGKAIVAANMGAAARHAELINKYLV